MNSIATRTDRTTLAKSDRLDRETFYLLTMTADLCHVVNMDEEMTEEETYSFFRGYGTPDHEIAGLIENARMMKRHPPTN
jgi:hypothetical protein